MKKRVLKHRFSLIELLVVCGLLMVLMGIGVGVYSLVQRKMNDSRCKAMIAKMSIALENYKSKTGYYIQAPNAPDYYSYFYVDKYTNDTTANDSGTAWPYTINNEISININELLTSEGSNNFKFFSRGAWNDPWGTPFRYKCPGEHNPMSFDLYSIGADKDKNDAPPRPPGYAIGSAASINAKADDITNWNQ